MAKYKQDSAAYQSYQDSLNLYTDVLDMANSEQNTYWNTRKKEIIDNYKRTAKGETVEYWKKAKAESKDADKSWYDQMIKKSIDEQKYYSNPKNIDKAIQDETKKHYNAFNIGTAYQLKTATNKNSNRYDYPDDGYFYTNMIRANNSSDREYKEYLNYFIKDRESELRDAIKSGKSQVSVSGMASTNIPGAKSEISNAKKLKKLLSSDIKPVGYTDSPESLRYPIYKKPVVEPPIATKPIGTNVKYDPTYENLRMRPLWATMAKQDTTSKIGTLNPLDPLYEKGFTYGEAQKFPEEIKKQYKLDYPIYQEGGTITREDYLRQQHQDYLKSQAEKGRKAVVEGREKFAKDYVIPAIKTVASFTPAGPIIGLADAYEAYQQGNTGWAIAGAGIEALPYVGKGVGKGLSVLKNLSKIEVLPSPVPYAHYRNIGGIEGYNDVLNRREIAPPIIPRSESTGLRSSDGYVRLPRKQFNRAYYAKKGEFSPALHYPGPYAVEAKIPLRNGFGGNWGYAPDPKIEGFINAPLDDPRIRLLKQYRLPKTEKVLFQKELPKKGKGGFIPIAQEGVSIRSDDRNWLERFNDKVYSGYQKHKPQLFKDFPITDIVEPVVSYLTGHADAEYGPLIAFTPSMGKMIAKPSKDFNNLYHYSRNPFLDYEDVNLFREGSSQMKSKYRHQANSPEDLPGGFYTTMNPRDGFMGGKYGNKMSIPANAKVKDLAITGRMTDRIPIKELKQFRSEGYDIIKGKNMLGQEEWIPLNKNKLFGWEKFNRSDYRSVPRDPFQKGGTIPKAQEGVKVSEDRRNWLQRTNDKIQTTYNKNKPQLLKDFPLLDLPGMVVEYVTGHSEDPDAGLAMVNPVGKIGKAIKVHQAAGKFKAKEKGINFVKN